MRFNINNDLLLDTAQPHLPFFMAFSFIFQGTASEILQTWSLAHTVLFGVHTFQNDLKKINKWLELMCHLSNQKQPIGILSLWTEPHMIAPSMQRYLGPWSTACFKIGLSVARYWHIWLYTSAKEHNMSHFCPITAFKMRILGLILAIFGW